MSADLAWLTCSPEDHGGAEVKEMLDVLMVTLTVVSFVAAAGLVVWLDWI